MKIYTIGFTKKTAEMFFTELIQHNVKRLIDVRLNNVSQLSGFAKRDDLKYFAKVICHLDYLYLPQLTPTKEILDEYKKNKNWELYERQFLALMAERKIENTMTSEILNGACLLCSEDKPGHCHRRLVAEYLKAKLGDIEINHL